MDNLKNLNFTKDSTLAAWHATCKIFK
jgi:hypothetical protein